MMTEPAEYEYKCNVCGFIDYIPCEYLDGKKVCFECKSKQKQEG